MVLSKSVTRHGTMYARSQARCQVGQIIATGRLLVGNDSSYGVSSRSAKLTAVAGSYGAHTGTG